jgi:cytosolic nonspecific dipeptidase
MIDLVALLNELVDAKGKILVPGIYDSVAKVTDDEMKLYDPIDFDCNAYTEESGCFDLIHKDKMNTLMHKWRYPSLSIHGIQGAFDGPGSKTVIPRKVTGKFSIRLVPDQDPAEIERLVVKHLTEKFALRNSPNKLKYLFLFFVVVNEIFKLILLNNSVSCRGQGAKSWVADYKHPHYQAARNAIKEVFNIEPDFTREGGSIPVTLTFQELTGKNVLLLPIGSSDDGAHSQNEKINVSNYIEGVRLIKLY